MATAKNPSIFCPKCPEILNLSQKEKNLRQIHLKMGHYRDTTWDTTVPFVVVSHKCPVFLLRQIRKSPLWDIRDEKRTLEPVKIENDDRIRTIPNQE